MNTPRVTRKSRVEVVQCCPRLAVCWMHHYIRIRVLTFTFFMPSHMSGCIFRKVQPFKPRRDWHVPELFHRDSCSNLQPLIIFYHNIATLITVYTMRHVGVLLLEQHAIIFANINLLIFHPKSCHHLLGLIHVLRHLICHGRASLTSWTKSL